MNETVLIEALDSGKMPGVHSGWFKFEPFDKHSDAVLTMLAKHAKILGTPHLGASAKESQLDAAVEIATAVRDAPDRNMGLDGLDGQ